MPEQTPKEEEREKGQVKPNSLIKNLFQVAAFEAASSGFFRGWAFCEDKRLCYSVKCPINTLHRQAAM